MIKTIVSVAGVKFKNDTGPSRQDILCKLYDAYWTEAREDEIVIELRREPDNEYDSNAVAVWVTAPKTKKTLGKIGFVPAAQSLYISQAVDSGRASKVVVHDMGCGGRNASVWMQMKISIRDANDSPEEVTDLEKEYFLQDEDGTVYEMID